jgi:GcrA cell cycle regulator
VLGFSGVKTCFAIFATEKNAMDWTEDRIELLKKLWAEGLSCSQIAAELRGVSRNSIIGKVHRLGLSGRAKTGSIPRQRKPRSTGPMMRIARPIVRVNTTVAAFLAVEPPAAPAKYSPPMSQRCSILQVGEGKCRWPVGDPSAPDFFFCGGKTAEGLVYCKHHGAVAYVPAKDRPSRRPLRPHYRD